MSDDVVLVESPALDWGSAPGHFRDAHAKVRADLRAVISERAELEARERSLRREIVLLRALGGEALDSAPGRTFAAGYSGPLDVETVREAWAELRVELLAELLDSTGGDLGVLVR